MNNRQRSVSDLVDSHKRNWIGNVDTTLILLGCTTDDFSNEELDAFGQEAVHTVALKFLSGFDLIALQISETENLFPVLIKEALAACHKKWVDVSASLVLGEEKTADEINSILRNFTQMSYARVRRAEVLEEETNRDLSKFVSTEISTGLRSINDFLNETRGKDFFEILELSQPPQPILQFVIGDLIALITGYSQEELEQLGGFDEPEDS